MALGLNCRTAACIVLPVAHVCLLFLGPLIMAALDFVEQIDGSAGDLPAASTCMQLCSMPASHVADLSAYARQMHCQPETVPTCPNMNGAVKAGLHAAGTGSFGKAQRLLRRRCRELASWQAARDFLVAPLAEEWTFRACMLPLLLASVRDIQLSAYQWQPAAAIAAADAAGAAAVAIAAGWPCRFWEPDSLAPGLPSRACAFCLISSHGACYPPSCPSAVQGYRASMCALLAPLFFGLAHVHHLRELVVHQHLPLSQAAPQVGLLVSHVSALPVRKLSQLRICRCSSSSPTPLCLAGMPLGPF